MLQAYQASLRTDVAVHSSINAFHRNHRAALVEYYDVLASQKASAFDLESATYPFNPTTARFALRIAPAGWLHLFQAKMIDEALAHTNPAFMDPAKRRVNWGARPTGMPRLWEESCWPLPIEAVAFTTAAAKAARVQTTIDHARLAVALERHWLRHRAYPERLDALVPEFLDRLPHDLFDGQPMRYRREGEQGFVLWSIGFDGKNDNAGPLHFKGSGSVGEEIGDLVWRYPQGK